MSAGGFFFYMENSAKNSHTDILVGKVKTGHSLKILICDVFFLNTGFSNCLHITLCSKSQQINQHKEILPNSFYKHHNKCFPYKAPLEMTGILSARKCTQRKQNSQLCRGDIRKMRHTSLITCTSSEVRELFILTGPSVNWVSAVLSYENLSPYSCLHRKTQGREEQTQKDILSRLKHEMRTYRANS